MASACTDSTHDLLDGYEQQMAPAAGLPLEGIAVPIAWGSHVMNAAILHVNGDCVAFVDAQHDFA